MQVPLTSSKKTGKQVSPWLIVLLLAGIIGGSAIALQIFTRSKQVTGIADMTVAVKSESLKVRIKASGSVIPVQTVNISPKTSGKLVELYIEQGDRVKKGEILARMDGANIRPQVLQAQASLEMAEANLAKLRKGSRTEEIAAAKARVESWKAKASLSNERWKRNQDLAAQGVITRDRLDELVADEQSTQANLRDQQRQLEQLQNGTRPEDLAYAEAQVAEARARLNIAQVQLDDTVIRAPFDGIITQKFTNVGAFVTPTTSASSTSSATSTSIVAVASGLEILAKIPEVDIGQIKVGQQVEIVADAFPDRVFKGKVRLIAPEAVIEQNVTSFQVRVSLETGHKELQSGMNADLRFIGQQLDNALVVPTVAIVTENGQTGLLVPDDRGQGKFRSVIVGPTIDNQTQILRGVEAGDRVFIKLPASQKTDGNR